jgi:hypothetical protein
MRVEKEKDLYWIVPDVGTAISCDLDQLLDLRDEIERCRKEYNDARGYHP